MTTGTYNASVNIDISKALANLQKLARSTVQTFQAIQSQSAIDLSERQQGSIVSAASGRKAITRAASGQVAPIARSLSSQYLQDTGYTGLIAEANVRNKVFGSMVRGQELSSFGGSGAEILGEVKAQQLLERIAIGVEANKILGESSNVEAQAEFKLQQSIRDLDVSIELLTQQIKSQTTLDKQGQQIGLRRQRNQLAQARSYGAVPLNEQLGSGLLTAQRRRGRRGDIDMLERVAAAYQEGQSPYLPYTEGKTGRLRFKGSEGYSARGLTSSNFRERFTSMQQAEGAFIQREETMDPRLGTTKVQYRDLLQGQYTKVSDKVKQKLDALAGATSNVTAKTDMLGQAATNTAGNKKRGMAFLEDMSDANVEKFRQVSSAMQGMMLGMSILNGDIMGLAFSLIFLQFAGFGKLALGAAGATLIVGGLTKVIKNMNKEAKEAKQLTALFAQFNANPFAQQQAGETSATLLDELGIVKDVDEFTKALVRFQFEMNRSGRDITQTDLILFAAAFAQAYGMSGSFDESVETAISALTQLHADGKTEIDGVMFSMNELMLLAPRFLASFTDIGEVSFGNLLEELKNFIEAGGEIIEGSDLSKTLRDLFTTYGEGDFSGVENTIRNFKEKIRTEILEKPINELDFKKGFNLAKVWQSLIEGEGGEGLSTVAVNAIVPEIEQAILEFLAKAPTPEQRQAWDDAFTALSTSVTQSKTIISTALTGEQIQAIATFLGVNVPTEEQRAIWGLKWNELQVGIKTGTDNARKTLDWSDSSTPAYALVDAKDSFITELSKDEILTKNLTLNWNVKHKFSSRDAPLLGPQQSVGTLENEIYVYLRSTPAYADLG